MDELTGFQRDVLYVIAGLDEPNGSEIKEQLEEYYETRVDRGQLYPNIDSLAEEGFIEKDQHEKRRNAYTLTTKGRREILRTDESGKTNTSLRYDRYRKVSSILF